MAMIADLLAGISRPGDATFTDGGLLEGGSYNPKTDWKEPKKWNFQFEKTAQPYLAASQLQGQPSKMLYDPNVAYASNLIQALRSSSNAPSGENSGFTQYQSAQK